MLLAFCLPPTVPLWIPVIGGVFAMAVVKHAFGGLGFNIFNPALMARAFLLTSWPVLMTTWVRPFDAVTSATPLAVAKIQGLNALIESAGSNLEVYKSLFFGSVGGSLGETSAFVLILGGVFLIWRKVITWHTPVTYISTVVLLSLLTGQDILFQILSGGLMLGAFFMATDYVTTPLTSKGKIIFGVGCGVITMVIRIYGGLPEGVSYSILIMNAFTPLIDRHTKTKPKGWD
jgi:electron transport complex protein RnfD